MTAKRRRMKSISVRRGDAAEEQGVQNEDGLRRRSANLMSLRDPQYLSVVKKPANRSPFKIVRSEPGVRRRRRRTLDGALLSIQLPAEVSEEDANTLFEQFGLSEDDYEVARDEEGVYLRRKRAEGEDATEGVPFQIANGMTAYVDPDMLERGIQREDHPGVSLVEIRFPSSSEEAVTEWLQRNDIDPESGQIEDMGENVWRFKRLAGDLPEGHAEIEIDDYAWGYFAATERNDVPTRVYRSVIEELYGRWGFGIIDFNQMMANEIFSRDAREANYMLWDVLDNILFYSELPLDDRQALVVNALNQFAQWLSNLMAALPRSVIDPDTTVDLNSQGQRGDNPDRSDTNPSEEPKETADMTTKAGQQPKGKGDENQEEVERQDAQETSEDTTAEAQEQNAQRNDGEDGTQEDTEKVFTRTDAEKIAASAVNSYIESQKATRSDGGGLDADTLAAAFAKANEPLVQRIDALTSKVQEIESEAVSRDDSDDETAGGGEQQGMTEEVKRKDPFRGSILPGLASVYPSNRRRA